MKHAAKSSRVDSPRSSTSTVSTPPEAKRRFLRPAQLTGDIVQWFDTQPREGRVLELPAGDGRTTQHLLAQGFEVTPADLDPSAFALDEPDAVFADMTKPLPFPDGHFRYLLCQEGVEHIEAPLAFARECARVLEVGGRMLWTTPNVLHMAARLSYFLNGHRTGRRGMINEATTLLGRDGDDLFHGHAFHWRYPQLRYFLRLAGFRIVGLLHAKYSFSSVLLSIPAWPFLRLSHALTTRRLLRKEGKRRPELIEDARAAHEELRRHMLSRQLLWGRGVLIVAERESPTYLEKRYGEG